MKVYKQFIFTANDLFVAERVKNILTVYFGAQLMFVVDLNDPIEKRRAVIQLINIGVSIYRLEKMFSTCREAINLWITIYNESGLAGLDKIKTGPKKVTDEIKTYILAKAEELNFCHAYRKIIVEGIKNNFKINLHINTISDILKKENIDISAKRYNRKIKIKKDKIVSQRIENLGLLFIFPFLEKFQLKKIFSTTEKIFKNKYYKARDYIYTFVILLSAELIQVEENVKNLQDRNMGILIGKNNIPSAKSFRINIDKIVSNINMEKFQQTICENYFKKNTDMNELYIDGHNFPYFGKSKIFKGYNPIRRMGQKSRTGYFINNVDGRPIYYILSDEYKGFREYLVDISKNINKIRGSNSKKNIIMVFDRGGYSKDFFMDIKNNVSFICWRTGKINLPSNPKWQNINIVHQGNEFGNDKIIKLEAVEKKIINQKGEIVGRNIWIKKNEKISPAYTNDKTRSLDELAKMLTRRWGAQENIFKPLKNIGIDKICTYKKELYPDDWLFEEKKIRKIKNPEQLLLQDKIIKTKKEMKSLKLKIADKYLKKSKKSTIFQNENELNMLNLRLNNLKAEKTKLPDKINITDIIEEKGIVRLSNSKKKFLDIIKILSYNVKQDIVDFIRPVYKDQRDINDFVKFLLRKSGEMKIFDTHLEVIFEKYRSKKKTKVLELLCEHMNMQDCFHPLLNKKIKYYVI